MARVEAPTADAAPTTAGRAKPLRLAFVGKGGAGKSSLVGTFTRLLARCTGDPVLVLDSDPMPGLAYSLAVQPDDAGVPDGAVVPGPEGGPRYVLAPEWPPAAIVERVATRAPDGVRLLQLGKSDGRGLGQPALHAYQQILDALVPRSPADAPADPRVRSAVPASPLEHGHVVGDLPGGTRQPFMGWGRFADTFLVVVEPTAASVLAARRLAHLATGWSHGRQFEVRAVANKVRGSDDAVWIAEHTGLEVVGAVPWDAALAAADRAGRAPLDDAPDSAAVAAVHQLVQTLVSDPQSHKEQP